MEPRRSCALRRLAGTRARLALLVVLSALVSVVALALFHAPHGVGTTPTQAIESTSTSPHAAGSTDHLGHAVVLDAGLTADCATCGPTEGGLAAACAVMLFLIAIIALPFAGRTRWFTATDRARARQLPRTDFARSGPDLSVLCISRT